MKPKTLRVLVVAALVLLGVAAIIERTCLSRSGVTVGGSTFYCVTVPMDDDADGGL